MAKVATSDYSARLIAVEVVGDYSVRVRFDDGAVRDADLRGSFVDPAGTLLGEPDEFARVKIDEASDTLVWPGEFFHEHGELLYEIGVSGEDYAAVLPLDRSGKVVPRISFFYGIAIYMYFDEQHRVPHFHAVYAGAKATFAIESVRRLSGELPPRAARLVREWAPGHRDELMADWERARAGEPLLEIEPLR